MTEKPAAPIAPAALKPAAPLKYKVSSKLDEQSVASALASTDPQMDFSDEIPLETSNKRIYFLGLAILIFSFIATPGILYLKTKLPTASEESVKEVTTQETETEEKVSETESKVVALKRSEISLEVLNGSGIAGLAGKTAASFEELDYRIIKVGNFGEVDQTAIYINPEVEGKVELLLADMQKLLKTASISGELKNSTASARIVVGRD